MQDRKSFGSGAIDIMRDLIDDNLGGSIKGLGFVYLFKVARGDIGLRLACPYPELKKGERKQDRRSKKEEESKKSVEALLADAGLQGEGSKEAASRWLPSVSKLVLDMYVLLKKAQHQQCTTLLKLVAWAGYLDQVKGLQHSTTAPYNPSIPEIVLVPKEESQGRYNNPFGSRVGSAPADSVLYEFGPNTSSWMMEVGIQVGVTVTESPPIRAIVEAYSSKPGNLGQRRMAELSVVLHPLPARDVEIDQFDCSNLVVGAVDTAAAAGEEEEEERSTFTAAELPLHQQPQLSAWPKLPAVASEELQRFASAPLSAIDMTDVLSSIAGEGNTAAGKPPLSTDMPFDVSTQPDAWTPTGQSTIARLSTELQESSQRAETSTFPGLSFVNQAHMQQLQQLILTGVAGAGGSDGAIDPQAAAWCSNAYQHLVELRLSLRTLSHQDSEAVTEAMNAIEVFMNHTPVGEDSDPHCFALRKRSQRFMLPSFQFITRCLLTTNRASILKVLNPWLPAASEDHVCNLTVATVLRTSRLSQIDRAVSQIDALLERLTKLIKARTTQVLQDNMDLLPPALVSTIALLFSVSHLEPPWLLLCSGGLGAGGQQLQHYCLSHQVEQPFKHSSEASRRCQAAIK